MTHGHEGGGAFNADQKSALAAVASATRYRGVVTVTRDGERVKHCGPERTTMTEAEIDIANLERWYSEEHFEIEKKNVSTIKAGESENQKQECDARGGA